MKWILILPLFALLLAGAKPIYVEPLKPYQRVVVPINTKVDSINTIFQELGVIIEKP